MGVNTSTGPGASFVAGWGYCSQRNDWPFIGQKILFGLGPCRLRVRWHNARVGGVSRLPAGHSKFTLRHHLRSSQLPHVHTLTRSLPHRRHHSSYGGAW